MFATLSAAGGGAKGSGELVPLPRFASASGFAIARVSTDSEQNEGDSFSLNPSISASGRFVAFESRSTNLVVGDNNGSSDVFLHDRLTGISTRISVDSQGKEGNRGSLNPSTSEDGRFVAFESNADNLVSGDSNGSSDIFLRDRATGITTRVSVDSAGNQGNRASFNPAISGDGRLVAFESNADNLVLGDSNDSRDIFLHDRATGITTRVSVESAGNQGNRASFNPAISGDGRLVAFDSFASNLVVGDTNAARDVFARDWEAGITARLSVDSEGNQGDRSSITPAISGDGRFVAFESNATNLAIADSNLARDIFVRDRSSGTTALVSLNSAGNQGNSGFFKPSISGDGRFVAFDSFARNLAPADSNGTNDIFVLDRSSGTLTRVSTSSAGTEGNLTSFNAAISADGRSIAFDSFATNLVAGDRNGSRDVFVVSSRNEIFGGEGDDILSGSRERTEFLATNEDLIFGLGGSDRLEGKEGNDEILGNQGSDILQGGSGDDTLFGGKDSDTLLGGNGNDVISGDLGDDTLFGGSGSDLFILQRPLAVGSSRGSPGGSPQTLASPAAFLTGDAIADFEDGEDLLWLAGDLTYEQLSITQVENQTTIAIASSGNPVATLLGIQASLIGREDFING